jgi:hypothetical protein
MIALMISATVGAMDRSPDQGNTQGQAPPSRAGHLDLGNRSRASPTPLYGRVFKEGTMLESRRLTPPVEKPSRLQVAITEWQRELVERAKVMHGDRREPAGVAADEF